MFKRIVVLIVMGLLIMNTCGFAAVVGVASELQKVREIVDVPYGRTIEIVKTVLAEQNIKFEKATIDETKAKIMGICSDSRTVSIEVYKLTDAQSKIEVRVGTSEAGMEYAKKIIESVVQHSNQPSQ